MERYGSVSDDELGEAKAAFDLVMTKVTSQNAEKVLSIAQRLCDGVDSFSLATQ